MTKTDKVANYEIFLNEKLKPDLNVLLQQRDKVYQDISEFELLKKTILVIQESKLKPGEPLKSKVDLGCNFYVQAEVPDPTKILVEVGLGFLAELTLPEALKFIEKKTKVLEQRACELTKQSCQVKANIKLTLEALRGLQNISSEDLVEQRNRRRAILE